jgi:hypothetical protein
LSSANKFRYLDVAGVAQNLRLRAGTLAFTYCQVPVVYQLARQAGLTLQFADSRVHRQAETVLNEPYSRAIFERTGQVKSITVEIVLSLEK